MPANPLRWLPARVVHISQMADCIKLFRFFLPSFSRFLNVFPGSYKCGYPSQQEGGRPMAAGRACAVSKFHVRATSRAPTTDDQGDIENMPTSHEYTVTVEWTGNLGHGTAGYRAYTRDHTISADGKPAIIGSSDTTFLGDASRWNPEELLLASVSACHKLWYLHLCADAGVQVLRYRDQAQGTMETHAGGGAFTQIVLHPEITISREQDIARAAELHHQAHAKCFIANSVNFPITFEPKVGTP